LSRYLLVDPLFISPRVEARFPPDGKLNRDGALVAVGGKGVAVTSTAVAFVVSADLLVGFKVFLVEACCVEATFWAVAVAAATFPIVVPAAVAFTPAVGVAFCFFEADMVQALRKSARTKIHPRSLNFFIFNSLSV
jgi:hypothetical protein